MRTKTDLGQPGQTEITKKYYSVFSEQGLNPSTKNLQAVFLGFLTCKTIFMNHFETDLRL